MRGQAAMEYLMTYGWALLIIVIVFAALLYMGVLNPQARMQESCTLPVGFQCEPVEATGDGEVTVKITNLQAFPMEHVQIAVLTERVDVSDVDKEWYGDEESIQPGSTEELKATLRKGDGEKVTDLSKGSMVQGYLYVKYERDDTDKYLTGTVNVQVS